MRLLLTIFSYVSAFIFVSCANQVPLTGGPKDITPPLIIESSPAQGSINEKTDEITLNFDSPIVVEKLRSELLTTPQLPEYKPVYKNKALTLKLLSPLEDSTTYTLNFRNSIKDLSEKNIAKDVSLTFSTGSFIDSLELTGTVYNSFSAKSDQATIHLYPYTDTFNIATSEPFYITKTSETGTYAFQYLKPGTYYLIAMNDKNNDGSWQPISELIGFQTKPLSLTQSLFSQDFYLSKTDTIPLKVLKTKRQDNFIQYTTPTGLISTTTSSSLIEPFITTTGQLEVHTRLTDTNKSTLHRSLQFFDIEVTDSLNRSFSISDSIRIDTTSKPFPNLSFQFAPFIQTNRHLLRLVINQPLFATSSFLSSDSLNIEVKLDTTVTLLPLTINPENPASIELLVPTGFDSITFKFPSDLLTTAQSIPNPETTINLKIPKKADFSTLSGTIKGDEPNYILQLIDSKYTVVRSTSNPTSYTFKHVKPGTYKLRVLIDGNNNGRYDSGNYFDNVQPEKFIYYDQEIKLRANWEVNDVNISF